MFASAAPNPRKKARDEGADPSEQRRRCEKGCDIEEQEDGAGSEEKGEAVGILVVSLRT